MSNIKCPFCQQELDYLAEDIYGCMYCPNCKKHDLFGNEKMWQELIRTRKALEIATHRLNQIAQHDCDQGCMYVAQNALEQITALERSELENLEMLVNNVFK